MEQRSRQISRGDAVALGLIATGAVAVAIGVLIAVVRGALEVFAAQPTVRLPVHDSAASSLEAAGGIARAGYTEVDVTLESVSTWPRTLLLLEGSLPALATIATCGLAYWLALALMRGRPFRRTMPGALSAIACLVIVGGILGQVAGAFARAIIVQDLAADSPAVTDALWLFLLDLDLAPLGYGFIIALVAGAFGIGVRLQRDTEGLV